jgi:ATP-dependent helicase HrpB
VRLWDGRDRLRPHRDPEIGRIDIAGVVLDVLMSGAHPRTFDWFEPPRADRLDAALEQLRRLGAIDERGSLTALGAELGRVPLHPRLARLLIAAGGAPEAARACAVLSERQFVPARRAATACDLFATVEEERALPPHVLASARHVQTAARAVLGPERLARTIDETAFRRAVLAAYPDRVARRRAGDRERFLLASGAGARLARESGVHDAEFIVAIDVSAPTQPGAQADGLIRMATRVEREWLHATATEVRYELDPTSGTVRGTRLERLGAIPLSEQPAPADHAHASPLLAAEYLRRGPGPDDAQLLRRLAFAGHLIEFAELVGRAAATARDLHDIKLAEHLPSDLARRLRSEAPVAWRLPNGREVRLDYRADGTVVAAVKIQQVFGLRTTPRIGARRVPITFELLAPNGRPAQVTSDLESFWRRGYAEVRKSLRARYPKHRWPENPHDDGAADPPGR